MNEPTNVDGAVPGGPITRQPAPPRLDLAGAGVTAPPVRRVRRLRWLWRVALPLVLVLVPAVTLALAPVWQWLDFDQKPVSMMGMIGMIATQLSMVLLPLWWLTLSGFRWRTKFAGLGGLALVVGAVVAAVAEWDVTGSLVAYPLRYRWQPPAEELLEQHRRQQEQGPPPAAPVDLTVAPNDSFPRYRGAALDGVVRGVRLATDWQARPPKELWRQPCGGGYAGFAVAGNAAVTVEQRRDEEVVVCYDRASGRERWAHGYPAHFRDPTGNGPRATPTIDRGEVFSLGATGWLVCLDGKTGSRKWGVNILDDNQAKCVTWGMTSSPLVTDKLVIVNAGVDPDNNAGRALIAYDRAGGTRVWAAGRHKAGYSSPQLARLAGAEQVVLFDAGGLAGFDPKDGTELWRHPWTTFEDMNIIQPLVLSGDRVLISSEASNGCALLQVRREGAGFQVEALWANTHLGSKFANPVSSGGPIYGLSNGYLVCLDAATGARRWRGKYYGHGQMLLVGEVLLLTSERGEVVLVAASPEGFRELAQVKVFKDKTWNTPALAGRQLFVRNHREMACFELPLAE
jgi:outer membrane protein assembly factor BamB